MIPATAPYAASSKVMQIAVGNRAGMPSVNERKIGTTRPTTAPQTGPQIKPQSKTGRCMGQSMEPIFEICPVRNGNVYASAKKSAARIIFIILL